MKRPSHSKTIATVALLVGLVGAACATALATPPAPARAEAIVPVEGPWSATSSVGLPVGFQVREGNVIDAHFGFNWGFCGSYESHLPNTDPIDANGHWSFEDTRGQTIEGAFIAPDRVEGTIVAVERMLPGCPATHATFLAVPGEVPLAVPPQVYVVADAHTGHQSRKPDFIALGKGLSFYFEIGRWHDLGEPVARASAIGIVRRGKRAWESRASLRLSALIDDGPGKVLYSKLHYSIRGRALPGIPRQGSHTYRKPK